ncbi:MAG: DMT family transporter [Calditrichia bacterium]
MTGYLLAILTGLFYGLHGTYSKKMTQNLPVLLVTWANFTFILPFLLLALIWVGIPPVNWQDFIWAVSLSFLINVAAWYLFFSALQAGTLSRTMPFTAFTPLFLIPVAFIALGELPDIFGIAGILLIITGGYGIHLDSRGFLSPIKSMAFNKGTRSMVLVALLWSISATAEKVAVLSSSQYFYAIVINLLLALAYTPLILRKKNYNFLYFKKNILQLWLMSLLFGLLLLFQYTALKYLLVSYVIAFKRAGIIVSLLLGALLFKEKNLKRNLLFTLLILSGVLLIFF